MATDLDFIQCSRFFSWKYTFPELHDYHSLLGGQIMTTVSTLHLEVFTSIFHITGTSFENVILLHLNIFSQFN